MEVATSLWSSPSLVTATPSSSGVVRELVPRAARVVRSTARTGFWGTDGVCSALSPRSLTGFQGSREDRGIGRNNKLAGNNRLGQGTKGTRSSLGTRRHEPSSSAPFVARGSALRSALFSTPFFAPPPPPLRGVSRKISKGGVPPLWPRHTAHPPIGSELRHPSPFSSRVTTIRLKIHAGEIRAGVSGGSLAIAECSGWDRIHLWIAPGLRVRPFRPPVVFESRLQVCSMA